MYFFYYIIDNVFITSIGMLFGKPVFRKVISEKSTS